jgi:seryl-tRNA synthetase
VQVNIDSSDIPLNRICLLFGLGLRASLDLRHIRDHVDSVQSNIISRGSSAFADAHRVKGLYERSVSLEFDVAQQRKLRNALTKKFGAAKTQEEKESVSTQSTLTQLRTVSIHMLNCVSILV